MHLILRCACHYPPMEEATKRHASSICVQSFSHLQSVSNLSRLLQIYFSFWSTAKLTSSSWIPDPVFGFFFLPVLLFLPFSLVYRYVVSILPPGNVDLKGDEVEKTIKCKSELGIDYPNAAVMHTEAWIKLHHILARQSWQFDIGYQWTSEAVAESCRNY